MFRKVGFIALFGALSLSAYSDMSYQGPGMLGSTNLGGTVHIVGGSLNGNFHAGVLSFIETTQPLGPIYTVCGDLYDTFGGPPAIWTDSVSTINSTLSTNLFNASPTKHFNSTTSLTRAGNLVAFSFGAMSSQPLDYLDTGDDGEGLQIAVWASLYNADSATLAFSGNTLTVGEFQISNITAGAMTYANEIWTHRNDAGNAYFIQALGGTPYHGQDQITGGHGFHPTPEPFTMGLGIASVGLFLKRRKVKLAK